MIAGLQGAAGRVDADPGAGRTARVREAWRVLAGDDQRVGALQLLTGGARGEKDSDRLRTRDIPRRRWR